ncbi:unnamed protein product [Rangifer tarandus platyrhynchus]|uniref:Uncharacterized protein n=1 Tax=Rangifer tarandus platyrhynchus TaxID=3082113 RepID=A0ABN8ZD40_RANTA|nr:unnamed protein product [Rangifer tarandus platyrhynchus]
MRFFPLDLEGAVTGLAATQSEQLGLAHRGDGHASLTAPSGPGGVSARFLAPRFWAVILLLGLAMMSKGMSYHGRLRCRWTDPAAQAEWPGPRQRSPLAGPEGQLLPVPPKLPASQHFDWEVAERSRKPAPLQRCPVASARHPARDQRSERGLVQAPEKGAISSSLGAEARSSSWKGLNCALFFMPMVSPELSDATFISVAFLILLVLAREEWVREKSLMFHGSSAVTPSSGNPETIPALSAPWPSSQCFSLKPELRPCLSEAGALHTLSCRLCSRNRNTGSLRLPESILLFFKGRR